MKLSNTGSGLAALLFASATLLQAQSITISPGYTNLGVNATLQYTAQVTGLTPATVTWGVNEIPGGNATIGTITSTGLYTAPAKIPSVGVLITALGSDGKTLGDVYVNIAPVGPSITATNPASPIPTGNYTVTLTGTGFAQYAYVLEGGVQLSATFVNSTTLKVQGYHGTPGASTFQVQNPGTLWGPPFNVTFATPMPQTISPTTATVALGATQQFTAPNATSFTATAGTISSSGLYTAPATMPSSSKVTVKATGPGGSASATVTLFNPNAQTIAPTEVTLNLGATQQFTSTGATSWAATYGTVTSAGLYTAPATLPTGGKDTVTATGPGGSASAKVTLTAPAQTISPTSATLALGATQQFTSAGATTWTATYGTVTSAGLYTAPATYPASGKDTVQATGPGGSASATVTLTAPPQTISPTTVSVMLGATQQFTAPNATSWAATAGTISSTGLYTAPATMPSSSSVTVNAIGPGGTASATVTLTSPQSISPLSVSLALGATQQFTSPGATTWSATYGTITSAGLYTAPASLPSSPTDTVIAIGPAGTAKATVTIIPPSPVILSVGSNNQLPLGIFNTTVTGSGFTTQSTATLNGAALSTTYVSAGSLTIVGFYGQAGPATLTVSNGSVSSQPFAVQVGVANPVVSYAAAKRFLEQAGFGGSPSDVANLQAIGFQAWLSQQFAMPVISNYSALGGASQGGMSQIFLTNAVNNADQLRQKVAWALSQIFVISFQTVIWDPDMSAYQQMLINDAFSSYPQIISDVTLSPGMGEYLNMANNAKADPSNGTVANENYARELMQLFSIGTVLLNQDGSVQTNASGPIPTYAQKDITEMARILTGWTNAPTTPGGQPNWGSYINSSGPMVPFPSEHDFGSKTVIGYTAAANLSPQADVQGVLTYLSSHPNTAPFISKQLIQHMVKSNPSPAYIQRVASAFAQSGGDMKTVITAILLDTEARANDQGGNDQPTDGHFQEPVLFVTGMVRAFGGQMNTQNYFQYDLTNMGQDIYDAPSVFNYYSPAYVAPGSGGLLGPELQIDNPNSAILRENLITGIFSQWSNPVASYGPGTTIDLTPLLPLAATPATLVNAIDFTLTHGVMPAAMKTAIVSAVAGDTLGSLHQVQTAIYLTLVSGYYNVWH